ncbi:hypothetical protein D3C81_1039530 [compost metagenome]
MTAAPVTAARESRHDTAAKMTWGTPSRAMPRTNCGPTLYPTAKRNIRKNTALTLGEMVTPSVPMAMETSRVAVTAPRLKPLKLLPPTQ